MAKVALVDDLVSVLLNGLVGLHDFGAGHVGDGGLSEGVGRGASVAGGGQELRGRGDELGLDELGGGSGHEAGGSEGIVAVGVQSSVQSSEQRELGGSDGGGDQDGEDDLQYDRNQRVFIQENPPWGSRVRLFFLVLPAAVFFNFHVCWKIRC